MVTLGVGSNVDLSGKSILGLLKCQLYHLGQF